MSTYSSIDYWHHCKKKEQTYIQSWFFNVSVIIDDFWCIIWRSKIDEEGRIWLLGIYVFLLLHSTAKTPTTHMHTHPYEHMYAILLLWALSKDRADRYQDSWSHYRRIAVDKDIAYHWKYSVLNPGTNPEKYKHPCQSRGLKLRWTDSTSS